MTPDLLRTLNALAPDVRDIQGVSRLIRAITPLVQTVRLPDTTLPWGRYLVRAAPGGAWNLQMDVFSDGYVGGIHAHRTWGAFWVLRGSLWSESYAFEAGRPRLAAASWVAAGGCEAFCPPESDWHRVGAGTPGVQTVSFHLYGPGFDLDEGDGVDDEGQVRRYRRGPWGDAAVVYGALGVR